MAKKTADKKHTVCGKKCGKKRLLTLVDQLFLLLESRKQPMHVGGLFLFEQPEDADSSFVSNLVEQMQTAQTPPTFPFNQVLHRLLFWQTDSEFQIEQHFRHIALPEPARIRELLVYISQEHSRLLDRSNPLWQCHIIEGIEPEADGRPRRFAMYFKIHHSLVDGIAAMRLVQKSLAQSSDETMTLPAWAMLARNRNQLEALLPINKSFKQILKEQLASIKPVYQELKTSYRQRHHPDFVSTLHAPASILNQRISSSRRIAAQSYDLSRLQYIAKTLKVSLNDVILAVCSGALRAYLLSLDALPSKPLTAFVPISLRADKHSASGNQISFVLANLGTNSHDPMVRLQLIHRSMNHNKKRFARMNQAQIINYSALAYGWAGVNFLLSLYPKKQAFNLIISNVAGSTKPLYWNGALLKALYPLSITLNGQAMNITFATYLDKVEFGITACSKVLPHVQDMLQLIEEQIQIYEHLCE